MLAQSMVEYGALASGVSTLQRLTDTVEGWAGALTETQWVTLAVVLLVGLAVWRRRPTRD
jgi:hypothetical protein